MRRVQAGAPEVKPVVCSTLFWSAMRGNNGTANPDGFNAGGSAWVLQRQLELYPILAAGAGAAYADVNLWMRQKTITSHPPTWEDNDPRRYRWWACTP